MDVVEENRHQFEKDNDNLEKAWEDVQAGNIGKDSWGSIAPEAEVERLESILEKQPTIMDEPEDIPELSFNRPSEKKCSSFHYEAPTVSKEEIRDALRNMNETQQQVFYKIREWNLKVLRNEKPDPFFMFLTGGAGSGKSHLIRCIYHETTRILSKFTNSPDLTAVLLMAPTGTAAFNIQGRTIHSGFAISKNATLPYQPLGENILNTLRSKFDSLKILIIDEISMVDQKILTYIHGRLSQIKHSKQPFGNVSILAVGDFYQLPLVRGLSLYKKRSDDFMDLWNGQFSMVTLTEIMRQKDDCQFANMLNRLRIHVRGQPLAEEDLQTLKKASRNETPAEASTALHIFPTNKQVNQHNNVMIDKECSPIFTSLAQDCYTDIVTGHMIKKDPPYVSCTPEDLQTEIRLGIGARVMLTRNVDTEDGLVNGALGSIIGADQDTPGKVTAVYVRFDNSRVGKKCMKKQVVTQPSLQGSVRIKPFLDSLYGKKITRKQLPLKLAWAATIHKVQGMTVEQIVVSLKKIFQPGMAYVALSRATTLSGLHILDFDPDTIYSSASITEALQSMPLFFKPEQAPEKPRNFVIILHNTEGLLPHLYDLKAMKGFNNADVICLTETWLSEQHTVPSTLFKDFNLYRQARSEAYTQDQPVLSRLVMTERGGLAMFVNKIHLQKKFPLQCTNLEVLAAFVNNALPFAVYRPPSYTLPLFMENLAKLLQEIQDINLCVIAGDFNTNILQQSENKLVQKFVEFGYALLVDYPTTEGGTCLDLVFVRGFANDCRTKLIPTYYSYHDAVKVTVEHAYV